MKNLICLIVLLSSINCYSQYDFVAIKLEIGSFKKSKNIHISLFKENNQYLLRVEHIHPQSDTTYEIHKGQFDEVVKLALSISSQEIINGMNYSDPYLYRDPIGCRLIINVMQQAVIYDIANPLVNISDRNLTLLTKTCKEIVKLANLPPRITLR